MLTPKCPPRDFRVSARENSTKNRLYRFKWNLGGRNLAGFCEEFASLAKTRKFFYINDLLWLCWEAAANLSLFAGSLVTGRNTGKDRHLTDLVHARFAKIARGFAKLGNPKASFPCPEQGDNRRGAGTAGDVAGSGSIHIRLGSHSFG